MFSSWVVVLGWGLGFRAGVLMLAQVMRGFRFKMRDPISAAPWLFICTTLFRLMNVWLCMRLVNVLIGLSHFFWFLNTGGGTNLNLVWLHLLFFFCCYLFLSFWMNHLNESDLEDIKRQEKKSVETNFTANNTFYLKNLKMKFWSKKKILKRIVTPPPQIFLSLFIPWICSKPVWITIQLTVAIYFHSFLFFPPCYAGQWVPSTVWLNAFFIMSFFCVQQKKEFHIGLEQFQDHFYFILSL